MTKDGYDIITVDEWKCPEDNNVALLTMPNVPYPLHNVAPRTLLCATAWNFMRKKCYEKANDTCEICGHKPEDRRFRHAHELYSIDYATQTAKFERCVCLCAKCHLQCIHTGRALTLFKKGDPINTKERLLDGAEHAFTIISDYNKAHPDQEPLRLFSTWVDYAEHPELKDKMQELIKKYDIKFYKVNQKWYRPSRWKRWKLIIGSREYKTPYANQSEWKQAMDKNNEKNLKLVPNVRKAYVENFHNDIEKALK